MQFLISVILFLSTHFASGSIWSESQVRCGDELQFGGRTEPVRAATKVVMQTPTELNFRGFLNTYRRGRPMPEELILALGAFLGSDSTIVNPTTLYIAGGPVIELQEVGVYIWQNSPITFKGDEMAIAMRNLAHAKNIGMSSWFNLVRNAALNYGLNFRFDLDNHQIITFSVYLKDWHYHAYCMNASSSSQARFVKPDNPEGELHWLDVLKACLDNQDIAELRLPGINDLSRARLIFDEGKSRVKDVFRMLRGSNLFNEGWHF